MGENNNQYFDILLKVCEVIAAEKELETLTVGMIWDVGELI